jgi:3-oxoacyl-[acyl-carrier protein] reductase
MSTSTIVVTGGGTGIGRATALRLAAEGRQVTVVGRRPEPLEQVAEAAAGRVSTVAADVSTEAGARAVAAALAQAGHDCHGLVCAAGGNPPSSAAVEPIAAERADWQASFESNVLSAVLPLTALRESLIRTAGRVVLISSIAALRGSGAGPYGAMKAALHGWVYDLARDLGAHGGTANVIAPGFVPDTEFWQSRLTEQMRRDRLAQSLVGRAGEPAEVASLIAWLLGPDGGWMTGQILSPNGGAVLGR